ncbi:hypothetical protein K426_17000 [Sphingobium sp. TKS]|nr:hypothetical protein K426_17000 [Sphingobium sp. TKS]
MLSTAPWLVPWPIKRPKSGKYLDAAHRTQRASILEGACDFFQHDPPSLKLPLLMRVGRIELRYGASFKMAQQPFNDIAASIDPPFKSGFL